MSNLTIKDKNCLIAQSLGWVECDWAPVQSLSNYFDDIEECFYLETTLTARQKIVYVDTLMDILQFDNDYYVARPETCDRVYHFNSYCIGLILSAKAEHRAEAYGKTLNLW
jgi:hypothetical protein